MNRGEMEMRKRRNGRMYMNKMASNSFICMIVYLFMVCLPEPEYRLHKRQRPCVFQRQLNAVYPED